MVPRQDTSHSCQEEAQQLENDLIIQWQCKYDFLLTMDDMPSPIHNPSNELEFALLHTSAAKCEKATSQIHPMPFSSYSSNEGIFSVGVTSSLQ